jgi:hypothetical protein
MESKIICMMKYLLSLFVCLFFSYSAFGQAAVPRVVVSTDIGGDPDDMQSMVRLLLYSNVLDIEGLIAAGYQSDPLRGDTNKIKEVVAAYGSVRNNLLAHEPGFPTADYLYSVIREGQRFAGLPGMAGVGNGFSTPGSELIIEVLSKDDDRPVWFLAWGGISTLAQAIWDIDVSTVFSQADKEEMLGKIRVYDIAGQDNAGAWIASTHEYIPYIRNQKIFRAMSIHSAGYWPESDLSDTPYNTATYFDNWFSTNIRNGHGNYGDKYPPAMWIYEGDTPSFLYLIPNGLNDPEHWWQGSWGGRFTREKILNPISSMGGVFQSSEDDYKPFYMYSDAQDTWTYPGGTAYPDNIYVTLHRWRPAFDNDFAARMDWTLTDNFSLVNHPPVVVLNEDTSKSVLYVDALAGQSLVFDAAGTYSPNPEFSLTYDWGVYPEPGTYSGSYNNLITLVTAGKISFLVPADASDGDEFHIVLAVTNNGKSYSISGQGALGSLPLTAYRRVVVKVTSSGIGLDLKLFLEGPHSGLEMTTELNSSGMIPLNQPYNQPPWNYNGTESVGAIPGTDVVDWILVELRDAPDAVSATGNTVVAHKAGFLLKDGTVAGLDGSSILQFNIALNQQIFVVIWHRNHLGIMSASGLTIINGVYTYDFSVSASQVHGSSNGYKYLGQRIWGMAAGDANQDKFIDSHDKTYWNYFAGQKGYHSSDYNLDGQVDNTDNNDAWYPNLNMSSKVPE